jgi:LuxR family maltose regulon positive regulatory protein
LPPGFVLEKDPDTFILRHPEGSAIGVFSVRGFSAEEVRRAAGQSVQRGTRNRDHRRTLPAEASDGCLLRARFFGRFELFCCGRKIDSGSSSSSKALSILKHLLVDRNEPVSQDHLMGWLWPESNLKKARWSLNSAIRGVRMLLSACPSSVYENCVLLEEGYYRLGPTVRVETDVDEFDAYYERGRSLEKSLRIEEAAAEYERAIELYRGDYLVEDLYEDWTLVERERLVNAAVDMLIRLAAHYYDTARYQESLRVCYRLLRKDPTYERAHALVMRCYGRLGLWTRVSHQYQLYQHFLQQRLGKGPALEMEAICRGILSGRDHGNAPF